MKTTITIILTFTFLIAKSQNCNLNTFAGNDTIVCSSTTELFGILSNNNCNWSSNNPLISFSNSNSPNTTVYADTCLSAYIYLTETDSNACSNTDTINICFNTCSGQQYNFHEIITDTICNDLSYSTNIPAMPSCPIIPNSSCCNNNEFCAEISHLIDSLQAIPYVSPAHWTWTGPANATVYYNPSNDSTIYTPFNVTVDTIGNYQFTWVGGIRDSSVQDQLDSLYGLLCLSGNVCTYETDIDLTFYIFNIAALPTEIQCYEYCTGEYSTEITGGIQPITFTSGSEYESNLCEGTYPVFAVDSFGCEAYDNAIIIKHHESYLNTFSSNVSCLGNNDGSATVDIINYSNNAIINWSNGESTATVNNLPAGMYYVTVFNDEGCMSTESVVVTEPPALTVNETITNETCFNNCDGICELNISGGVAPYSVSWSNGALIDNIENLCAGDYFYTITDINGCIYEDLVHITGADSMNYDFNYTENICYGTCNGNIQIISPMINELEFNWSNNSSDSLITNLCEGNYSVTITKNNNCPHIHNFEISENSIVNFNIPNQISLCPGDEEQISINTTSGIAPFTYIVNGDTSNNTFTVNSNNPNIEIYIIDANNCNSQIQNLTVSTPDALSASLYSSSDSVCINSSITINATITGGSQPITITNQEGENVQFPINYTIHSDTSFTYTFTDACNNTITSSINVYVYNIPNIALSADNLSGCSPLEVNFTSNQTNAIWSINNTEYSNGSTFNHIFTTPGTYYVNQTVTTNNNCISQQQLQSAITVFSNPIADFDYKSLFVSNDNVKISLTNNSVGAMYYLWEFNDGNNSEETEPTHTFITQNNIIITLTATNSNGCKDTITKRIETSNEYTLFVPNTFSPNGDGVNKFFKPVYTGIDTDRYHMYVYDRWGEKIWETDNAEIGWDGRAKGKSIVKNDVYTWLILFYDMKGNKHEKAGLVLINR